MRTLLRIPKFFSQPGFWSESIDTQLIYLFSLSAAQEFMLTRFFVQWVKKTIPQFFFLPVFKRSVPMYSRNIFLNFSVTQHLRGVKVNKISLQGTSTPFGKPLLNFYTVRSVASQLKEWSRGQIQ